jgi:hypothetical protein
MGELEAMADETRDSMSSMGAFAELGTAETRGEEVGSSGRSGGSNGAASSGDRVKQRVMGSRFVATNTEFGNPHLA